MAKMKDRETKWTEIYTAEVDGPWSRVKQNKKSAGKTT